VLQAKEPASGYGIGDKQDTSALLILVLSWYYPRTPDLLYKLLAFDRVLIPFQERSTYSG
jgi:hypothetical protein